MTVAELIKELEKIPQDYDVVFLNLDGYMESIEDVCVLKDNKQVELY